MNLFWLMAGVLALSALGTGLVRRYAIARSVLDIPNHRSSHSVPTPRGGGVAIVLSFLAGTLVLAAVHRISSELAIALVGAGATVAVIGFIDDHRHLPALWRLFAHFAAGAWALVWLGGLPPVAVAGAVRDLGYPGDVLVVIGLVWLLNLYNFMDGIDGIAAVEAVTVCLGAIVLYAASPGIAIGWYAPALLAVATGGFLVWNFPPARIFMGDAGSGFLGVILGVLALDAANHSARWLWSWLILLGAFVVDATVTLLFRIHRGEKIYEAHRHHAYQHAAHRFRSHRPVTLAVGAINVCWLLPMALLVGTGRLDGALGLMIAYVPMVLLAVGLGAGRPRRG